MIMIRLTEKGFASQERPDMAFETGRLCILPILKATQLAIASRTRPIQSNGIAQNGRFSPENQTLVHRFVQKVGHENALV